MKKYIVGLMFITSVMTSISVSSAPYHGREMIFRVGMSQSTPDDGPANVTWNGRPNDMTLEVGEDTQPSFTFQYFIDRSWSMEVMMAFPYEHEISYRGYFDDPDAEEGSKLGRFKQVPTTFSLLYYPDKSWFIKPYAGVGVNYTFFYGEKITSINSNFFRGLKLEDTFALAAQVGTDIQLSKRWSLNTSVRYYDMETTTTFIVGTGTPARSRMSIDPLVYSVMIGYKF